MTKDETNVCKGFAILLMFVHHLFSRPEVYADYSIRYFPFSYKTIISIALLGKVCVAIFVFLSAYGITVQSNKKDKNIPGGGVFDC